MTRITNRPRGVRPMAALGLAGVAALVTGAAAPTAGASSEPPADAPSGEITVLFGSSGEAETAAITAAADRFTEETGVTVNVTPAQDLQQQLTQGFAGGTPPDVFYLSPEQTRLFQDSLFAYGDQIDDVDDYYPALIASYTVDDQLYCLPKDFSNLGLVINTDAWEAAGLTEDDVPTTWDELSEVSKTLTTGDQVGLVFGGEAPRVGAFMVQAGGWFVNDDQTEATANSPENIEALQYVQDNVMAGNFQYASQVEAGWGGEAFGLGKAAMVIEGPWIAGALSADFPDVNWMATELPEGPAGAGTLTFSNCWGVAADGNTDAAVAFVEFVSQPEEQQAFSEAFGVIPPRASLGEWYATEQAQKAAFASSIDSAQGPVTLAGFSAVNDEFNSQLLGLADGSVSPEDLLERTQEVTEEVIDDQG